MNRRLWILLLATGFLVGACRSAGPASPPPTGHSAGTGAPVRPNPAPTPPAPAVMPAPVTTPARMPLSAPTGVAAPPVETGAAAPPPAAAVPPQPSSAPIGPRPYQDILKLKQAGLSDEFLLNKIRTENVGYQLTTSEILELRANGISETVLEAMMRSGQSSAATAGTPVARRAEFSGLARVGKGFLVFGTSTKYVGRLAVDGETVSWFDAEDPKKNFSVYVKNIKEIFDTCVLRPGQNLCLEFGILTYTGEEYRFRDPGWKNGENRLVTEATKYFRQAFPNLFFSQRAVSEL